ncbi:unnamed protein product, partial [Prorocentrum cordatum]
MSAEHRELVIWMLNHPSALLEGTDEEPGFPPFGLDVVFDDGSPTDFDELMLAVAAAAPHDMIEVLPQDAMLSLLSPDSESDQEDVHAEILAQAVAPERCPFNFVLSQLSHVLRALLLTDLANLGKLTMFCMRHCLRKRLLDMQYLVKLRRQTPCNLAKLKGTLHSVTLSWDLAVTNRWTKLNSCSSFSLFNTRLQRG